MVRIKKINLKTLYMKKLFTTTLIFALALGVFAQDGAKTKKISFGVGLEGALPMGGLKSIYPYGGGLTVRVTYNLDEKMAITGTSGVIAFIPKSVSGTSLKAQINIPFKAGYKYMLTEKIYGLVEAGYTMSKTYVPTSSGVMSVSSSSFTYAPGVGIKLGILDTSLRYESYGSGANFLGLRLGLDF